MQNNLKNQTSPYLLQHADNPVNWYPWGDEAFDKARKENKPIFLSIGYSTCHWCHVMAHESFEDEEVADILNRYFVSVKVDKEERPDIDSIYMSVCQALTGSGGWPMTVIMTAEQKPFFAGTYFPKKTRHGYAGLIDILETIAQKWNEDKNKLVETAEEILTYVRRDTNDEKELDNNQIDKGIAILKKMFDEKNGGFGGAPKFPTPHNLLFLMQQYIKERDEETLYIAEKTLTQMYRGGLFDHIGGGFCRYSTDSYFLVPHFEKMLYDNALLIMAYCQAYDITKKELYLKVAKKTAKYLIKEMLSEEAGFYCAQDADSEGVEGKFYLFKEDELLRVVGENAKAFNKYFDITAKGNFEGQNIPNLLKTKPLNLEFEKEARLVYEYRKNRYKLHLDDKILTYWNSLAIVAMCWLYRITGETRYLKIAKDTQDFINKNLSREGRLKISYRKGMCSGEGLLDDYAGQTFALLELYQVTGDEMYLSKAKEFCQIAVDEFFDHKNGGFYMYGEKNEQLIVKPKETYDGAIFSGNSAMTYNLVRLYNITENEKYRETLEKQVSFMCKETGEYPAGHTMFLIALSDYYGIDNKLRVVGAKPSDVETIIQKTSANTLICYSHKETEEYPLKNGKTTLYFCKNQSCIPPITIDEY